VELTEEVRIQEQEPFRSGCQVRPRGRVHHHIFVFALRPDSRLLEFSPACGVQPFRAICQVAHFGGSMGIHGANSHKPSAITVVVFGLDSREFTSEFVVSVFFAMSPRASSQNGTDSCSKIHMLGTGLI
jgi:hypothetical protein